MEVTMRLFRKKLKAVSESEITLSIAYLEEVYKRLHGEKIPLGVGLVTTELLGYREPAYKLVSTAKSFQMGVINYLALMALIYPDNKTISIIISEHNTDLSDQYHELLRSEVEYIGAFGLRIMPKDAAASVKDIKNYMKDVKKALLFTNMQIMIQILNYKKIIPFFPVVQDDGISARVLDFL
jgi:hypothetical protein